MVARPNLVVSPLLMTLEMRHVANCSDDSWGNPLTYIGLSAPRGATGGLRSNPSCKRQAGSEPEAPDHVPA
jgi:hypothetical protein